MADGELEALKAKRMAELQQQYGGQFSGGAGQEEQQEKQQQQEEMKNSMLSQLLDQQARARLNTIAMTKPEKAKMVESMLIQMARSGQIGGKLGESQLKSLLERVNEQTQKSTTVTFDRRRAALDSDDEDF